MGDEHETVVTNIHHEINITKQLLHRFKLEIANKEVIVCMGNTRSGKSTVVNYIQGNELEALEDTKRTYIQVKDMVHTGPAISHGALSYTELPTVWEIKAESDTVIVDVPGFEDNRGVARDVVNTLFFNQLKHARSIKLLLVSDINDIDSDNVQAFTNAVARIQTVIDDFNELKDAVSVIFTKDCKNYNREDVIKLLKRKILDVPEMQVKKDLIYHIIKHIEAVGILRMPLKSGKVSKEEVDCNIEGAIFNTHSIIINANKIKFSPSEQTHSILLDVYQKYMNEMNFVAEVKRSVQRFENYFKVEKYVFASTEEELNYTKTCLQYILARITTEKTKNFLAILELKESLNIIAGQLSENFEKKLNFFKCVDEWLLLDEYIKQMLAKTYKNALSSLENQINNLIEKINAEVDDRSKETVQHIISQVASDRNKLILMCAGFIPLAKKTLTMIGVQLPESYAIEIAELSGGACGLLGAGAAGVAAGGYGALYYQTIHLRRTLRKEQGRC